MAMDKKSSQTPSKPLSEQQRRAEKSEQPQRGSFEQPKRDVSR